MDQPLNDKAARSGSRALTLAVLSLATAALTCCDREQKTLPAVTLDVRDKAAMAPSPLAGPAGRPGPAVPGPTALAPAAPLPPHPPICEVEIRGQVKQAGAAPRGRTEVVVTDKDCLAAGAGVLGRVEAKPDGTFFVEVFPKWGSDVSLCAQLVPAPGQPARVYGKAGGTYHAEKLGEIVFSGVAIALAAGPPHRFPPASR